MDETDGGEGAASSLRAKGVGGELPYIAEVSRRFACDLGAASGGGSDACDDEVGGAPRGNGAGDAAEACAAGATASDTVASGAVAGSAAVAASDCVDPEEGGAGAKLAASGAERGADVARACGAVGDDGGLGRSEGDTLAFFNALCD